MEQAIGRPRVAKAYAWLISLVALLVIVQAVLFGAFYEKFNEDFIDVHWAVAFIFMIVLVLIITPLSYLARFPRELRMGHLTVFLAVLWIVQWTLGSAITEDNERWVATLHIPNAFLIFGLGLYLTGKAHRAVRGRKG